MRPIDIFVDLQQSGCNLKARLFKSPPPVLGYGDVGIGNGLIRYPPMVSYQPPNYTYGARLGLDLKQAFQHRKIFLTQELCRRISSFCKKVGKNSQASKTTSTLLSIQQNCYFHILLLFISFYCNHLKKYRPNCISSISRFYPQATLIYVLTRNRYVIYQLFY